MVLDANVFVSAVNFPGNERFVLELALRARFEFYLPPFILEEVTGVLVGKFGRDQDRSAQAIRAIENAATASKPARESEVIEGGDADNRVLDCTVAANTDCLVISDRRYLLPIGEHQGAKIVNAPRFLSELRGRQ